MAYTKPQIVAQNSADGVFAAGCPKEEPRFCFCQEHGSPD